MNPAWHIHAGNPPLPEEGGISFALLLNLAAVANCDNQDDEFPILYRGNDAKVADPITPKSLEIARQRVPKAPRIVGGGNAGACKN